MNATAPNRKYALARTILLGLAASLSLGAQAGETRLANGAHRAVVVSYADLDLTSAAGANTLYARLKAAARKACGPEPITSLRETNFMEAYAACYEQALTKAVAEVDSERLQALHAERSDRARFG